MDTARAADFPGLPRMSVTSPCTVPHPGIEPESPALQADSLPIELPGNSQVKKKESLAGRISKGPSSFNNVVTILILSLQSKCVSLSPRLELRITVSVCSVNKWTLNRTKLLPSFPAQLRGTTYLARPNFSGLLEKRFKHFWRLWVGLAVSYTGALYFLSWLYADPMGMALNIVQL